MFRKTALAMAMLGAFGTGKAVALGLGDIELKSALNQPLNAEVELLSATEAEMAELKVAIGSAREFAAAGIERPIFLTKMKFDVVRNASGAPVIRITSREVVREPFLDFLMDISWSKGRLLREYTVLVDPPVTMPAPAPVTQAPVAQSPAPVFRSSPPQAERRMTHTAIMPPVSVQPGEYMTQRNDTLWQIAQQVRPDQGVSIEQTMLGLLRANPEAFVNNNINNLKAGYILRVPDREELTSMSKGEALRESRAQYAAWQASRGMVTATQQAGEAGDGPAEAVTSSAPASSLQLVAADDAEGAIASGSAELEALQRDLLIANEALEEQRRQGEEMSDRLGMLEEQIANMQRLIQLKDDELARLQAQAGSSAGEVPADADAAATMAEGAAPAEGAETAAESLPADGEMMADAAESMPEGMDAVVDEGMETVEGAMDAGSDALPAEGMDRVPGEEAGLDTAADAAAGEGMEPVPGDLDSAPVSAESLPEEQPIAEAPVEPVPAPALDVPQTATSPGFVDRLLANPLWLGAGAVVLALLGFFGLRRKRSIETEFQESILQAASGKDAADSEIVATRPGKDTTTSEASSLLSEFAVSDMGSMKSDGEADPLAEADVYLAYGRYQQAEDLIKEALQKDAGREDLNLKLLEVYLAAKNAVAFDEHAQNLMSRLEGGDDPVWEKVAEMGRELSPDNPMYQSGAAMPMDEAPAGEADESVAGMEEDLEFDAMSFDEPQEDSADQEIEAAGADDEDNGLDFDLGLNLDAEETAGEETPDSLEFSPPESLEDSAGQVASAEPDLDVATDSLEAEGFEQDTAMEFDLDSLDLDSEEMAEPEEDSGEGALADLDEVSTKLDLARAYIDMGDPDGAKSILDEVIEEGSDSQKDEARGILEKMA